jgi:hypothetical protein
MGGKQFLVGHDFAFILFVEISASSTHTSSLKSTSSVNNGHDYVYVDLLDHIYNMVSQLQDQKSLQEGSSLVVHSTFPPLIPRPTALCGGWWRVAGSSTG